MSDDLGTCSPSTPCRVMRLMVHWRNATVAEERLYMRHQDAPLTGCPWCGADLPASTVAAWPWAALLAEEPHGGPTPPQKGAA